MFHSVVFVLLRINNFNTDYTAPTITIDNNPLNVVDKFTYLGSTISQNALIDDEISARIGKASGSFGKIIKRLWSERGVRLATKINVYGAVVLPTLLYGCEAWTPYRRHIRRLDQFHVRCLKPGVHTNDFAPIYGRRAKKLGHASLATVFLHGRFTFQPILWENLESPVLRYQPITTAVITDACLNTRWHHGAYTSPNEDNRWLH